MTIRERIHRFAVELRRHRIAEDLEPALALSYDDYQELMQGLEIREYVRLGDGVLRLDGIRLYASEPWKRS